MKFSTALILAPIAVMAAPALEERALQGNEQNTAIKLDSLARGSKITLDDASATYVGQENSSDISMFQINQDPNSVFSLVATQGEALPSKGWNPWGKMGIQRNGLCDICTDDTRKQRRSLEERSNQERTFLFIKLLFGFKKKLWGWCDWNWSKPSYPSGCLEGYPPSGCVWVGHGGHQCSVGDHGYIHYPQIPNIGWDNGFGGKYCGSHKGIQYWYWAKSRTVCPINIKKGWKRPGCSVHGGGQQKPPICSTCSDNTGYWDSNDWATTNKY